MTIQPRAQFSNATAGKKIETNTGVDQQKNDINGFISHNKMQLNQRITQKSAKCTDYIQYWQSIKSSNNAKSHLL